MTTLDENSAYHVTKDHAEAFGAQSKLSNRLWLTLIILIFFVVLPSKTNNCVEQDHTLPFGIGCIDGALFDILSFFMLAVFMISFCQTHAGVVLAYRRAHSAINRLGEPGSDLVESQRRFFDAMTTPSLSRVGSLPILLLVKSASPSARNSIAAYYYLFLKIFATTSHLGIPILAFSFAWQRLIFNAATPEWVLWFGTATGVVTFVASVQICIAEVSQVSRTFRRFMRGEIHPVGVD